MDTNVPRQERVLVFVEELDQKIQDVAFEGKIITRYRTFNLIVEGAIKNPNYSYLYYGFLDRDGYTGVTMMIKNTSMNLIEKNQTCLQKRLYIKVENFGLRRKSKRISKKVTCL
jgi:hypothetical protein